MPPKVEEKKAVRLIDVANATGTCRSTVSKVLLGSGGKNARVSAKTAARIQEAAKELKFRPNQIARQLKGIPSKMLGVLVGVETSYIKNTRLQAIEEQAYQRGYSLMVGYIHAAGDRFEEYAGEFESRGIDGLICMCHLTDEQVRDTIETNGRIERKVFLDASNVSSASCVTVDRGSGIREAVEHLHSQGRRRIGHAVGDLKVVTTSQRRKGYVDGMRIVGLEPVDEYVYVASECHGAPEVSVIEDMIDELVVASNVDSIITPDDRWAAHLVKGLKRRGFRVPDDVAVIGFDNDIDIVTASDPELTSIDQQAELVAKCVVDMAIDGHVGLKLPQTMVIPSRLVIRASSQTNG